MPSPLTTNFKQLEDDTVEIEGIKFSGDFFRGFDLCQQTGVRFEVFRRDDGVVSLRRIDLIH